MRFNREKFNDFALNLYSQAVETDQRVYRLYLRAQLIANAFWAFAWVSFKWTCRLCLRPQVFSVAVLSIVEERLVVGLINHKVDAAPAMAWLIVFALLIGVILAGLLLPRSTRDPGVEFAPLN